MGGSYIGRFSHSAAGPRLLILLEEIRGLSYVDRFLLGPAAHTDNRANGPSSVGMLGLSSRHAPTAHTDDRA